jgi:hypothetical protein
LFCLFCSIAAARNCFLACCNGQGGAFLFYWHQVWWPELQRVVILS